MGLDEGLSKRPGFKASTVKEVPEMWTTSTTDSDYEYINHGSKQGVGYLLEATVDCKCGIVTGVDFFPANEKESMIILRHLEKQQIQTGLNMKKLTLYRVYDTGAVQRGLELLKIEGFIALINFPNTPEMFGFQYDKKIIALAYSRATFVIPSVKLQQVYRKIFALISGRFKNMLQLSKTTFLILKFTMKRRKIWIEGSFQ
jgi:hypothetical protein